MSMRPTKSEYSSQSSNSSPTESVRVVDSFFCYNLDEKITDLTGPIQRRAQKIRNSSLVNWQQYLHAELINEDDYRFMVVFQKSKTKEERDELLEKDFKATAFTTLTKVIQRASAVEDIQKVLILIDDMLWEDMSRVHRFNTLAEPCKPFLELLDSNDEFVRNLSSRILAKIIAVDEYEPSPVNKNIFLNWLKHQLRTDNFYLLCVARCLQHLLRYDKYRLPFLSMNGIFKIIRILSAGIKLQIQYQLVFCLWVSSYNSKVSEKLQNFNVIQVLLELLESCPGEIIKLPRVIFATFRNVLEKPGNEGIIRYNALIMIQCKILKYFSSIRPRVESFEDPELLDDFNVIEEILSKHVAELSTFDVYKLEVKSGRLEWSVVHTSKPFWEKNAHHLNDNEYELLKILISLLESSKDSTVLCVAAHDLGAYMNHYVRGKTLVAEFGGKNALLKLLTNEDPEVKYHALKSLQILMLSSYDLLAEHVGEKVKEMRAELNNRKGHRL